jgi:argininosuccinate lyase
LNATDLADYLVIKGIPFREAHAIVGKLVGECIRRRKRLEELSLEEFQAASGLIEADVYPVLEMENVVKVRSSFGGTAFEQVRLQLEAARAWLKQITE